MICERCGYSMPDGALTCDNCGTYLGKYSSAANESGVRAFRQGRMTSATPPVEGRRSRVVPEYGDYEVNHVDPRPAARPARPRPASPKGGSSRPDTRRGVPVNARGRVRPVEQKRVGKNGLRRRKVNWALICVIGLALAVVGIGGYLMYMRTSDTGKLATARRNIQTATEGMFTLAQNATDALVQSERETLLSQWGAVSAQYYWQCGQEYLDAGDLQPAILGLRIADVLDPDNYDGLELLANAYELYGDDESAEAVYLRMIESVSPSRTEAYTALINLYQQQERNPEAADVMLLAYNNTGRESFRLQRNDFIPQTPQINLTAGRYDISAMEEEVHFTSPQGYDIYYTLDDEAVLPDEGTLTLDGYIVPEEGTVNLRAVCVSGDLVSDPLSVTYVFYYPSPPAPKCNLAPNTYSSRRTVSLRPGDIEDENMTNAEKEEAASHYVYYYTIDGSTPTTDSPMYDGTPIQLPSGRVTLRAVCVNQYGKMSSTLEVGYKFNVKPDPLKVYANTDVFGDFALLSTTREQFLVSFGSPSSEVETTYPGVENEARHLAYSWGYAVFILDGGVWLLVRVEMNSQISAGPRGVGIGSTEAEVTGVYKDFGQVEAPNGTRGLYYAYPDVGAVNVNSDGTRSVVYSCESTEGDMQYLEYHMNASGVVDKLTHYVLP